MAEKKNIPTADEDTKTKVPKKKYQLVSDDVVTKYAVFYNRRPREAALKAATRGYERIVLREPLNPAKNEYRLHIFNGKTIPIPEDKMRDYERDHKKTQRPWVERVCMDRIDAGVLRLRKAQALHPDQKDELQTKFDERVAKAQEKLKRKRREEQAAARAARKAEQAASAGPAATGKRKQSGSTKSATQSKPKKKAAAGATTKAKPKSAAAAKKAAGSAKSASRSKSAAKPTKAAAKGKAAQAPTKKAQKGGGSAGATKKATTAAAAAKTTKKTAPTAKKAASK